MPASVRKPYRSPGRVTPGAARAAVSAIVATAMRRHRIGGGAMLVAALAGLGASTAARAADTYTASVWEGRHRETTTTVTHQGDAPQEARNYDVVPGAPGAPILNDLYASATDADHGTAFARISVPAPAGRDTVLGDPFYAAESSVDYTLRLVPNVQSFSTVYQNGIYGEIALVPVHVTAHGEASYATSGGPYIQGFGGVADFSINQCSNYGCGAQTFNRRAAAILNPWAPAPVPNASFDVDQTIDFLISAPDFGIDSPINIKLHAYAADDVVFYPAPGVNWDSYGGSAMAKVDPTFTIDDPVLASLYHIEGIPSGAAPPASAVPEPTSWAMMLAGLGTLGATLRRSRKASHAQAA